MDSDSNRFALLNEKENENQINMCTHLDIIYRTLFCTKGARFCVEDRFGRIIFHDTRVIFIFI